ACCCRGAARSRRACANSASSGGSGLRFGAPAGRTRRPGPYLQGGRLRVARTWLLHVPGHECRPPQPGRTLRSHFQPQLRGASGQGRSHAPDVTGDGRRRGRNGRTHRSRELLSMQPLIEHEGVVIPLNRANIDTDMLLPKQYLKSLESFGFGDFLFDDERYLDPGEIDTPIESRRRNPACILNSSPYDQGSVVLAQANFGCGSSREHAVWALRDFGVRVVVAPSFGDIFRNNCFNNGVLPLQLEQAQIDALFAVVES